MKTSLYLSLITVLLIVGFIGLSSEVIESLNGQVETVAILDNFIKDSLQQYRTPSITRLAIATTFLGSSTFLGLVILVNSFIWNYCQRKVLSLQIILAGLGAATLSLMLKLFIERPRPSTIDALVNVGGFSYPSGHSLGAAAVYLTLAIIYYRLIIPATAKKLTFFLFFSLILSIAASRVYLGVHFFSDVIGGVALGCAWAIIIDYGINYSIYVKKKSSFDKEDKI